MKPPKKLLKNPFKRSQVKDDKFSLPGKLVQLRFDKKYVKDWYLTQNSLTICGDIWNGRAWVWFDDVPIDSVDEIKYGPDNSLIAWVIRSTKEKVIDVLLLYPSDIDSIFSDDIDKIIGRMHDKVCKIKK